ncbi:helix-turn-helix transcriptional regulator [Streptomyces sp. NPDC000983]|uniref:helix-turn-helix domain-containing protein n=1 Tax=Streptomyces sp. NPDC000983 TaxID=3154373 RepID=UPI003320738D
MGDWQPLPDELPPEVRHFVTQLRLLKDRTGLSLVALGARTAYSKSSWQRYLNAVQPPPRQAVDALCRVAGESGPDAERFVVRWELAVQVWPRTAGPRGVAEGEAPGEGYGGVVLGEAYGGAALGDGYEDDPTVPWWEAPPAAGPPSVDWPRRLLLAAAGLTLLLVLTVLGGAYALG